MIIGVNASAALKENPTGVEEYVFQLIEHLAMIPESKAHRFVLYLNPRLRSTRLKNLKALPEYFSLKFLKFPFLWTQIRFAWEMRNAKIDALFIPVHILPFVHPDKSIVVLHGLEYEYFPGLYPFWHRMYLRWSTKYALKNSSKIIVVSENTKMDLVRIYGGDPDKITVVHHGIADSHNLFTADQEKEISTQETEKYILYLGRVELKKNIMGIIKAYDILRKKNNTISNKLILAGAKGFGFDEINNLINHSDFKKDIVLKGYVTEEEKNKLWGKSLVFLFPSFYEGFGLPILEAQKNGIPVLTSNISCMPEIAGKGALFADPKNIIQIAEMMEKILINGDLRTKLVNAGYENIKRFSWKKCARETLQVLTN